MNSIGKLLSVALSANVRVLIQEMFLGCGVVSPGQLQIPAIYIIIVFDPSCFRRVVWYRMVEDLQVKSNSAFQV